MSYYIAQVSEMLTYTFMQRALVAGVLISLCASLLGISLVLKRYSMIGDGLSHVAFGALSVASALNASPLFVAIPVVAATSVVLLALGESKKIKGDAAIALISSGSLAIGIIVVSKSGLNTEMWNYLFGSILGLSNQDVWISVALSVFVIASYIVLYNRIFAVTFDESFSRGVGIRVRAYNVALAILSSMVIVIGMRLVGSLLITSLIVFPALTAMRWGKSYKAVTILSGLISIVTTVVGISLSYIYAIPTGASIVMVGVVLIALSALRR